MVGNDTAADGRKPLDTTIEVVTPENIAFRYQLAGPFRRLPAFLVDWLIRVGSFVLIVILMFVIAGLLGANAPLAGLIGPFVTAGIFILYFFFSWFYCVFFEAYFSGRTPGKWILGLRVIGVDGHPISGQQALLRNLLRTADLAPPMSLAGFSPDEPVYQLFFIPTAMVGLVAICCSRRLQRLGDMAAGTMVVIDERGWQWPMGKVDDLRIPALASFVPADFRVSPSMAKALAAYAERRPYLSPGRRREVARCLAQPLAERFGFRDDIDPDLMLSSLYYRVFMADAAPPPDLGALARFSPLAKDAAVAPAIAAPVAVPPTGAR